MYSVNPEVLLENQTLRKVQHLFVALILQSKSWNHLDATLIRSKSSLMENVSFIPSSLDSVTYSFELKPKWGDLPK